MKKLFKTVFLGYKKEQVDRYIINMKRDYEEELSKKKDRLVELSNENRELKAKIQEFEEKILQYQEQEAFISKALVKAEQKAQAIIDEGHRKAASEARKIELEKSKWKIRLKEIRKELLEFEKEVYDTVESFRSEINYLTSKEVCADLLEEDDDVPKKQEDKSSVLSAS